MCAAAPPSLGHAIPTAALALEFQRAGNDVAMVTDCPGHTAFYQRLGLPYIDLGGRAPSTHHLLARMLSVFDDVDPDITIADWRRDLWLVQHVRPPRCRISILRNETFLGYVRKSPYLPNPLIPHTLEEMEFLRRFNCDPASDPKLLYRTEAIVVPSVPELDPLPPQADRNYPHSVFIYTGPLFVDGFDESPIELQAWSAHQRADGRRVVLVTLGTGWGREFCLELAAAMDRVRFSCIMAIPKQTDRALVNRYAHPHLLIVEDVGYTALLPHCDAVVHHAGHGTLLRVMLAGKPSITVPSYQWDREDHALRMEELGCGVHLHDGLYRGGLNVDQLNDAVDRVVSDPTTAAATEAMSRRLAQFMAERGPAYLLRTLEERNLVPARGRRRKRRLSFRRRSVPRFPWLQILVRARLARIAAFGAQLRHWRRLKAWRWRTWPRDLATVRHGQIRSTRHEG